MDKIKAHATDGVSPEKLAEIERIHTAWNEALDRKDADAITVLYAPDCVLESPLVRHIQGGEEGVIRGRDKFHEFARTILVRTPRSRHIYRTGFFTDGHTVMWEYPHFTPEGEQMDFVEVMEIENGLIRKHRVYWGWFGVKIMEKDEYRP